MDKVQDFKVVNTLFKGKKRKKKKKKHSSYIDYQKKRATKKVKEKRNIVYTIIFIIFFTRVEFESFFYWFLFNLTSDITFYMLFITCHFNNYEIFC